MKTVCKVLLVWDLGLGKHTKERDLQKWNQCWPWLWKRPCTPVATGNTGPLDGEGQKGRWPGGGSLIAWQGDPDPLWWGCQLWGSPFLWGPAPPLSILPRGTDITQLIRWWGPDHRCALGRTLPHLRVWRVLGHFSSRPSPTAVH